MLPTTHRTRCTIFILLAGIVGTGIFLLPPIPQDPSYHLFADQRTFFGIPNFFDVLSNLPFCLVGGVAIFWLLRTAHDRRKFLVPQGIQTDQEWVAWFLTFCGVFLTGFGSAYYHWNPDTPRLFWDRLPMTLAFSAFFSTQLMERLGNRVGSVFLPPLVVLGGTSVVVWIHSEMEGAGDLRLYAFVQFFPLLGIPLLLTLFPPRYNRTSDIMIALAFYAAAKAAESLDRQIFFLLGGIMSGHSLKHLFAAGGAVRLLIMLQRRSFNKLGNIPILTGVKLE